MTSAIDIPTEVLRRFGGITSKQKRELFRQYNSLEFVVIPDFLKPRITTIETLDQYGVCVSRHSIDKAMVQYFVCPKYVSNNQDSINTDARFCCGGSTEQFCCGSAEFRSGIRLVSPILVVSPSIVIGSILAFLLIVTLVIITAYARVSKGSRTLAKSLRSRSFVLQNPAKHESKSSFSSSRAPPTNALISSQLIHSDVSAAKQGNTIVKSNIPQKTSKQRKDALLAVKHDDSHTLHPISSKLIENTSKNAREQIVAKPMKFKSKITH